MASNSWPNDLPQWVLQEGYEETGPSTALRTEMDAGPAKVRRRYTAGVEPINCQIRLDSDDNEVDTFRTFVDDTLSGGTEKFDWVHPRTQESVEFRFITGKNNPPYTITPVGGTIYNASFRLEKLPS